MSNGVLNVHGPNLKNPLAESANLIIVVSSQTASVGASDASSVSDIRLLHPKRRETDRICNFVVRRA